MLYRERERQSTNHFNIHAALKTKFLNFHIHTPSGKTKKKRTRYTNKKRENGKLKIQQPSSLTFPFKLLKVPIINSGTAAMYADDTTVTFSADDTASLELQINKELECLNKWLVVNKLSLNVNKTEFMLFTTRQKRAFINDALSININGKPIRQVKTAKTLGLHIEETQASRAHL